jgi:hypothetical protein
LCSKLLLNFFSQKLLQHSVVNRMENKTFYIRFKQNQPFNVETHFIGEANRRRQLKVVGDLIQAYFPSIVDPSILSQYTLHQVVDGEESEALLPDISLDQITGGRTAINPLRIKSQHETDNFIDAVQLMHEVATEKRLVLAKLEQESICDFYLEKLDIFRQAKPIDIDFIRQAKAGITDLIYWGETNIDLFDNKICNSFLKLRVKDMREQLKHKLETVFRVAPLDYGILDAEFSHHFDFDRFENRVFDLFQWFSDDNSTKRHVENYTKLIAPYFPIVQSSGTGKTLLLHRLTEVINAKSTLTKMESNDRWKDTSCMLLLCQKGAESVSHAHEAFDVEKYEGLDAAEVWRKLNELTQAVVQLNHAANIVLLFDEAQFLLADDAKLFRKIR